MAISYGYFNSINEDRVYNADDMSKYFDGLITNGVYESVGSGLQVYAASGMDVVVMSGRAIIDCKWLSNDSALVLSVTGSHVTLNRWTAIVVRLDKSNRLMEIDTVDGTPATTPTQPTMTNTSTVKEICLAMVYVAAGATEISQADITDMRASSLCGWITGLIEQVNTSTLFVQWQTAYENYYEEMTEGFDEWFDHLTQQLNVDTYIKRYTHKYTLASGDAFVLFTASGYTYDSDDIVTVYINGLLADVGTDYTVEAYTNLGVTTWKITLLNNSSNQMIDAEVFVEVLKSKIGF